MAEFAIHDGVSALAPSDWNRCLPGFLERHDCLVAIETAGLAGFGFRALTAWHDGRLVACAPAFISRYDIATTLDGRGRRAIAALRRVLPNLVSPRLVCLGSPCTETAPIGLATDLDAAGRADAVEALMAALYALAARERADLVALKDLTTHDIGALGARALRRFAHVAGLPVATLDMSFGTIDEYLAGLSSGTRRDMRRKLRAADGVRIERTRHPGHLIGRILELYGQTRSRADMAFETLTPDYFRNILSCEGAFLTLYWRGDDLLAVNLLIETGDTLLDKFFCMDAEAGRPLNLYFLSWFENLRYCFENGIDRYQAGQAAYANKLRLGCSLRSTRMCFRHRNPLIHRLLAFAAPRLAADVPHGA